MNKHTDSCGAMSVDIDGEAIDYQPVDSWLARVGGLPSGSKEASTFKAAAPKSATRTNQTEYSAPNTMTPSMAPNMGQFLAKIEHLYKRVNEQDNLIYTLKEQVNELENKKGQLNQELAGLTNAKSAIKTINQRLNTIQFGFSRILDRVEVLEKTGTLEEGVRSTNPTATAFGGDRFGLWSADGIIGDGSIDKEGNPLNVLNSGPNRRGRKKRRALDRGEDGPVAVPSGESGTTEEIAQMEALLSKVVKKLAMLKMVGPEDGSDNGSLLRSSASLQMFCPKGGSENGRHPRSANPPRSTDSPSTCATTNGDTMMSGDGDVKPEVQL